jgi:hypothetical protein
MQTNLAHCTTHIFISHCTSKPTGSDLEEKRKAKRTTARHQLTRLSTTWYTTSSLLSLYSCTLYSSSMPCTLSPPPHPSLSFICTLYSLFLFSAFFFLFFLFFAIPLLLLLIQFFFFFLWFFHIISPPLFFYSSDGNLNTSPKPS